MITIHELAAKAMKHGGLSTPSRRITVRSRIDGVGGEARLNVDWTERGGPPVACRTNLPLQALEPTE
jgi:two-component sensor histidine kinase